MCKNILGSIVYNGDIVDNHQLVNIKNDILSMIEVQIKNDSVLGIALPRTPALIASILVASDLKVPFVPIDINLPSERLNQIINDANVDMVITIHNIEVDWKEITKIFIDSVNLISHQKTIITNKNKDIMYILFTSGSTGKPKGVEVTLDGFNNFVEGISEIINFSSEKRIACLTTVSFDIFFLESIMALYKGLTVILANEEEQRNPKLMAKFIQDNLVDMIQMTPSRMRLLLNHDRELSCLKNVKEIMIGGEPFPLSLLWILQDKTTAKIYNMYGPTETTIWSTVSDLTNKNHIDIGYPIKDTEIYIVDKSLSILPNGQVGEICIAGKGLAKGYVGRDDLTIERFVRLPQKSDIRIYRTGDIGRYLPDGNLEYLGRADNQVKIRGYRIELEEIEAYLNQLKGINQSIVIALEKNETNKVLEAFYTSDIAIESKDISEYLSLKLPPYMIPGIFRRVESFIQTENGKIDRKRVFECVEIRVELDVPQIATVDSLSEIQKKTLDVVNSNLDEKFSDSISLHTDFSSIGIDSIAFIKIIVTLESEFSFEFDDEMMLITKFPTIGAMVEYVKSKTITYREIV